MFRFVQKMLIRMMTTLYEQETSTMCQFIDDTRRSLASTFDDLHDEQEVLAKTSEKICKSSSCLVTPKRRRTE